MFLFTDNIVNDKNRYSWQCIEIPYRQGWNGFERITHKKEVSQKGNKQFIEGDEEPTDQAGQYRRNNQFKYHLFSLYP
jgi:hypothetical protein